MPESFAKGMQLDARSSELQSVIASAQVTDSTGARLDTEESMQGLLKLLRELRSRNGSVYVVGNGGSASVASHSVTDFVKVAKLRATTLHDASLITCMANDFGYENAFAQILGTVALPGDALLAISSSGNSPNIRNAASVACRKGCSVVTLSGFAADNPLRSAGDLNIWLDSHDYGMVEIGHQFVLHNLADRLRIEAT